MDTTTLTLEKTKPHRIKMSYKDYLTFAGDAEIVEWVEGEVINYMPPVDKHQDLMRFLSSLFDAFIELNQIGLFRFAPFEVKLWPNGPSREPDIFFVAPENRDKLTEKRFEGPPNLIIEIVSPSSVTQDRVHKFTEYEKAGVKEYWIIDPRPRQQQCDFYVLDEHGVYQAQVITEDGIYYSTVIPKFWFKLNWLWQEPLPNSQLALAEVMMSLAEIDDDVRKTYEALYKILSK